MVKEETPFPWLVRLLPLFVTIILTTLLHATNATLFPLERTLISTLVYVGSFIAICRFGLSFVQKGSSVKQEQVPINPPPSSNDSRFKRWIEKSDAVAQLTAAAIVGPIGFAAGSLAGMVWWYLGGSAFYTLTQSCLIGGSLGVMFVLLLLGGV